jgi:ketosteroid isomerase-like protein
MGVEENKQTLRALLAAIEVGDAERIESLFLPEAHWVIPRSAPEPYAGTHVGAKKIAEMMVGSIAQSFVAESVDWRPGLMVGEGDHVMAEANLRASTPGGEVYDNHYVFVAELDSASGRIAELREHVDTKYAAKFFES